MWRPGQGIKSQGLHGIEPCVEFFLLLNISYFLIPFSLTENVRSHPSSLQMSGLAVTSLDPITLPICIAHVVLHSTTVTSVTHLLTLSGHGGSVAIGVDMRGCSLGMMGLHQI